MSLSKFWDRRSNTLFLWMFAVVALLNVNYGLLRSARSALAVADLGGGAKSIPWFELLGTMPGAVLMTLGLSWLLNRFSIQKVFYVTLFCFTSFFLLFALVIYPLLPLLKAHLTFFQEFLPKALSMLFFVMAELWKIALFTVLFWGMINQLIPLRSAKLYYAPLMLSASIGTIVSGPIVTFCTSDWVSKKSWGFSLIAMMLALSIFSILAAFFFKKVWKVLERHGEKQEIEEKAGMTVLEGLKICLRSPYLMLLAWVTIADYVAYALGEIIFLDVLKQKFPDPREYCDFMGKLSFWNGLVTAFSALVITPFLLNRCRWVIASLVTPVCLLLTEGAFFFAIWHPALQTNLLLLVVLGSIFFCLVRAAKYTLFDTSKEISFILLPPLEKMQGKLVVDGMCARLGRGSGSMLSLIIIQICGGTLASAPLAGGVALIIATSCVFATSKLGRLVEAQTEKGTA